jgi:hypothetical protein
MSLSFFSFIIALNTGSRTQSAQVQSFNVDPEAKGRLHTPFTTVGYWLFCDRPGNFWSEQSSKRRGKELGHANTWMHCQTALLSASLPPAPRWYKLDTTRIAIIRIEVSEDWLWEAGVIYISKQNRSLEYGRLQSTKHRGANRYRLPRWSRFTPVHRSILLQPLSKSRIPLRWTWFLVWIPTRVSYGILKCLLHVLPGTASEYGCHIYRFA